MLQLYQNVEEHSEPSFLDSKSQKLEENQQESFAACGILPFKARSTTKRTVGILCHCISRASELHKHSFHQ